MNQFKLGFTQTFKAEHEIIVETELTKEELSNKLSQSYIDFSDCWNIQDCADLIEDELEEIVLDITEGESDVDDMEWNLIEEYDENEDESEDD